MHFFIFIYHNSPFIDHKQRIFRGLSGDRKPLMWGHDSYSERDTAFCAIIEFFYLAYFNSVHPELMVILVNATFYVHLIGT